MEVRLRKERYYTLGANFCAECRFRDYVVTISLRIAKLKGNYSKRKINQIWLPSLEDDCCCKKSNLLLMLYLLGGMGNILTEH